VDDSAAQEGRMTKWLLVGTQCLLKLPKAALRPVLL